MPATMTHQVFALEIIDQAIHLNLLQTHRDILMLATQGPDPFFFYSMLPWQKQEDKKRIHQIGSTLHKHAANHLEKLYEAALNSKDDGVIAYMIGAVMHYMLDAKVHPYVYARSGFDKNGQLTPPYNQYHSHMETLIDVAICKYKNIKPHRVHPAKNIKLPDEVITKIDKLYVSAYPDFIQPGDYKKALKDMQRIYTILYDAIGIKRALIRLFFTKKSHPYATSHPPRLRGNEKIDILNVTHQMWCYPENGKTSDASVLDLFVQAKEVMMTFLKQYEKGQVDFVSLTQGINYDGLTKDGKHTHQSLIFPL